MKKNRYRELEHRKRRIDPTQAHDSSRPMFTTSNIHDDLADRTRGIAHGGIGALNPHQRIFFRMVSALQC